MVGRRFIGWAAMCIALGFAAEPVQARDRESGTAVSRAAAADAFAARPTYALSPRDDLSAAAPVTVARRAPSGDWMPRDGEASALVSEPRKRLTLFRFNTPVGEVAVQPVFGSAKGAQFSLGF